MPVQAEIPIQGHCPACGQRVLWAGLDQQSPDRSSYRVFCVNESCPDPEAASKILADSETEHVIKFTHFGFTVRHPLRERIDNAEALFNCQIHEDHAASDNLPVGVEPGRYRVTWSEITLPGHEQPRKYTYERLSEGVAG